MGKQELIQQLAALDHQINTQLAQTELPRSSGVYRPFPVGNWVLALLCVGWWLFGSQVPYAAPYHPETASYAFWAGVVLGGIALLRSVLCLFRPKSSVSPEYLEATKRIRELQEQRRVLQEKIRAIEQG